MIWQVPSQIYGNTGVCRSDDEACELPEHSHTHRQRTLLSCKKTCILVSNSTTTTAKQFPSFHTFVTAVTVCVKVPTDGLVS